MMRDSKSTDNRYRDMMHDIIETHTSYTVVQGIGDVVRGAYGDMGFKEGQKDWYWLFSGHDHHLDEALYDIYLDTKGEPEGEYQFTAIFTNSRDEGHILEHIELDFIQTFEQRHRERALDLILEDDDIDLFK